MRSPQFHLSLNVESPEASAVLFERVLKARIEHRDPSGYVNVVFAGCQITFQLGGVGTDMGSRFHFGANFDLPTFEDLARHVRAVAPTAVMEGPMTWDEGTPLERRKMYVKCPAGFQVEIKGYP